MKKYILAIVAVTIVSGIGLFTACDKTEDLHKQAKTTTKEMNSFNLFYVVGTNQCQIKGEIGSDCYVWNVVNGNGSYSFNSVFVDENPIRCTPLNDNTVQIFYGPEDENEMVFTMSNISLHEDTLSYNLSLGNFGTQSFQFVSSNSILSSVLDELFKDETPNTKAVPTYTYIYQMLQLSTRETIFILQVEGNPYFPEPWEPIYLCYLNHPSFMTPCYPNQIRVEHHNQGHHNCWIECKNINE